MISKRHAIIEATGTEPKWRSSLFPSIIYVQEYAYPIHDSILASIISCRQILQSAVAQVSC